MIQAKLMFIASTQINKTYKS